MPIVTYRNLRLAPSRHALNELLKLGLCLEDCKNILEQGYDAPRKRKAGTVEKWFDKGKSTVNIVIKRDYDNQMKEECWVIIHLGMFKK